MPAPQLQPDTILEIIPDPDTVRTWLGRSIRQSALLRSLLRLAERKAGHRERPQPQLEDGDAR